MTTVYVRAYTRADGTQVRAYTREIEGASNKDISLSMKDLSKDIERSFEDFSHSTKNDIDMYEKTIKSIESYLGDYPLTIANAKMEDIDHIEAIKSHLDQAKSDLKILKTVREKAGMNDVANLGEPIQIASNETKGLVKELSKEKNKPKTAYQILKSKKDEMEKANVIAATTISIL